MCDTWCVKCRNSTPSISILARFIVYCGLFYLDHFEKVSHLLYRWICLMCVKLGALFHDLSLFNHLSLDEIERKKSTFAWILIVIHCTTYICVYTLIFTCIFFMVLKLATCLCSSVSKNVVPAIQRLLVQVQFDALGCCFQCCASTTSLGKDNLI